ncbi:uncharacterized protein EKO05_0005095 [Ascochyta rabiei]|uniref:uncharacterized protein n=1 Tax=Didymella rabiei TaxID=5454 RepID=UPI00220956C9|nr:uncharacterized protein EKO05_0005095 [Ascochyta rabiei]UPX14618.1 hypothetical protein EKO05_0005095 [Ascochyta rabiei]
MWLSEQPAVIQTQPLVETIIGRLLLSFANVVCLFLDDFSTPEEGVNFLRRCAGYNSLLQGWKPQIIFVTNSTYKRNTTPNFILPTMPQHNNVKKPLNKADIQLALQAI